MANYELMSDEIILLQSQNAASEKSLGGSEIILTDKRIIFISKGFFGKVKGVEYYPLDQISIFAGEPRIECIHETGIYQLRIGFKSAIKTFNIDDGSKKTILYIRRLLVKILQTFLQRQKAFCPELE